MLDNTAHYDLHRPASQGSNEAKLDKLQKMRDEGLVSDKVYQKKKDEISSNK